MDLPRILNGKTKEGVVWSVEVKESSYGDYFAVVQVGSNLKASGGHYDPIEAKQAGCQLLSDTLAEMSDV